MIWKNETRRLDELKPAKYNPRRITKKQREQLAKSIDTFDVVDPIIINTDGTIIGGHQRYGILREKGIESVDVRVPQTALGLEQEKELNLRLNQNLGEFDLGLLTSFGADMLVNVGFDGDFVDSLFSLEAEEDDYDVASAVAKIEYPNAVHGDVYVFEGGHRLMCGSSLDFNDVEKLMNGEQADLILVDPPYYVDYKGKKGIKNDDQSEDDFAQFLKDAFTNAFAFSKDHANLYCWFAMSNYTVFRESIASCQWRYMQVIFWMKDRFTLSMGWYYHRITEPCMIFYKDWNNKFVNPHYAKNHDMWQMDKMTFEESLDVWFQNRDASKDYKHPTQKPIRLQERAMKRNSEVNQIVLDLFVGGGATLLLCDQLKRRCYAMEFDPRFVDVIIDRYTKLTGKTPKRL